VTSRPDDERDGAQEGAEDRGRAYRIRSRGLRLRWK
jgi:hypothetical protein